MPIYSSLWLHATQPPGRVHGNPGGTNLLDEKVADLLEQHSEPPWGAVGLARGPNQTDHVEQRLQPRLHLWELHGLEGFQVAAERHQVRVDVLRLHQSWKERESHPPCLELRATKLEPWCPGREGSELPTPGEPGEGWWELPISLYCSGSLPSMILLLPVFHGSPLSNQFHFRQSCSHTFSYILLPAFFICHSFPIHTHQFRNISSPLLSSVHQWANANPWSD